MLLILLQQYFYTYALMHYAVTALYIQFRAHITLPFYDDFAYIFAGASSVVVHVLQRIFLCECVSNLLTLIIFAPKTHIMFEINDNALCLFEFMYVDDQPYSHTLDIHITNGNEVISNKLCTM